ncbi:molybdopterin-dependent oxidoreductase [Pseudomonas aeruginosa]|nr:molybdopterin-dependent oxidoreductase [Pseudomonas aeruginosa]
MAFGHVILKEFHLDRPSAYFVDYCRQYTDMPMLVLLEEHAGGAFKPTRYLRAADLADNLGQDNNPEWKTIAYDERSGGAGLAHRRHRLPLGRVWQVEHRRAGRQER